MGSTFAVIGSTIDMVIPEVLVANDFMQFAEVQKRWFFGDSFVFDIASSDLFIVTKGAQW